MKLRMRILSGLLALALLCPAPAVTARAAEPERFGTLSATVRLDYAQKLSALRDREVRAELLQGDRLVGTAALTEARTLDLGDYEAEVTLLNEDGGDLGGGSWPGYLCLTVRGLPQGEYALRFRGEGYCGFTQAVTLDDCSRHVVLGTGDGTFSLGDLDDDGDVDRKDRQLLADTLGSTEPRDLARFDLSGDGRIDVTDLAYVNRQMEAEGGASVLDTALTAPPVNYASVQMDVNNQALAVGGDLEDLFRDNRSQVTLEAPDGGPVRLDIPFEEDVSLSQVVLTAPEGQGMPRRGAVSVEDIAGNVTEYPFDTTLPEGVHAIGKTPDSQVITISLGRRVAVKRITITVTEAEGGGYVALESIQFLRDIVPETPAAPNTQVKNLAAQAGNAQVRLTWDELPNVSGYLVEYSLQGGGAAKELRVDVTEALVTGLENLKTYLFTVTPVDGTWKGRPCTSVSAVPQPSSAPSAPDMVSIKALDSALSVSWKSAKEAEFYEVFYRPQSSGDYLPAGGQLTGTSTVINGLTNDVTYEVYVTAGNGVGVSGPSRISLGTPKATDYTRPAGIPTLGLLDNAKIQSIRLADSGNVDNSQYTAAAPFRPENMIDGDFRTHWTANSTNFMRNEHVVCTFREPVDLYSAIWVPRLDGTYVQNLRAYSVRVWYEGESLDSEGHLLTRGTDNGGTSNADVLSWPEIPNRSSIPSSRFAILPFGPVEKVTRISVAVEQAGYSVVSLSELMFLEYNPERCLPDNVSALFTDTLHTKLSPGVSQTDIDALRQRLAGDERNYYLYPAALDDELKLAEELLQGGTTSGVVLEGIQSRSSAADSRKYGQGGSDLQPLGAAARAGQEITVYAQGIPDGAQVTVFASQFNAEVSAWRASMGTLTNGRNVLLVPQIGSQNTPRGGSLYLTYSGVAPQDIKLHVRRAMDIPVLELSDWHTLDERARRDVIGGYVDELDAYCRALGSTTASTANCLNVTELSLPAVLLSLPALAVQGSTGKDRSERISTLYDDVLAWEDVMHICKTTQGIDNTYAQNDMTSRQNIRCMQMFAGAFMYAAGNHIGIGYGSCGGMACGKPISKLSPGASANQLFGWGIIHEIGHNMDKLGRAEITNNLYSLMVQTFDGSRNTLASRLEKSGKYPSVFTKTAQGRPGQSNDVFVQLALYWQLHLAYDSGEAPLDFYNRFFKAWKSGAYTQGLPNLTYDERLALTASGTAGKDLTEFCTRWGMRLSKPVTDKLAAYGAESRALWYLSDQSRRDRLAGAAQGTGSVTLAVAPAAEHPENSFTLSIQYTLTQGNLQGFEILRSGTPIAFLPAAAAKNNTISYTDIVGSANHRTYTYSVRAYDTLGICFGESTADEVRISYDKTVDPGAYTLTRSGETVTVTLSKETAISGWKVLQPPAEGAYTVSVAMEGGKPVQVRSGSFDTGNQASDPAAGYVSYFQKPGAGQEDTRIWTYDAKTVTITGIPASVPDESIRLITWAGDDIAFLEGGFAGLLSKDYVYGDEAGDVIKAGTLVIAGTYRGDPVYNTVRLEGRFTRTTDEGETTTEERPLDGQVLLLAEIPADGAVSDISDGLFLFIPNVQREAELQDQSHCDGANLLPSELRAVLYRTDDPNSTDSRRTTAETLWIPAPGGADLPALVLEGGNT